MVDRLLRLALRRARRNAGLAGELWTAAAAVMVGVRVLRWLGRTRPEVIREKLAPGETLMITNRPQPS